MTDDLGRTYIATVHPSSILRADDDTRDELTQLFVSDLQKISQALNTVRRPA